MKLCTRDSRTSLVSFALNKLRFSIGSEKVRGADPLVVSRFSNALKPATVLAFAGIACLRTKVTIRITKAHARGTSIPSPLPMRC